MPIVLKSESLNLLEPSGPVQACNGIAFSGCDVIRVTMLMFEWSDEISEEMRGVGEIFRCQ